MLFVCASKVDVLEPDDVILAQIKYASRPPKGAGNSELVSVGWVSYQSALNSSKSVYDLERRG